MLLQACGLLQAISEQDELNWEIGLFRREKSALNLDAIQREITILHDELSACYEGYKQKELISQYRLMYTTHKRGAFVYEFSDEDLNSIQALLDELRAKIASSDLFDEFHKRRLLIRLEKLQSELHKKQSDLDHYWGLIGDAGVAVGKFGKDAKPFVDMIKQITKIIWKTQAKAESLPDNSPQPLLPSDE